TPLPSPFPYTTLFRSRLVDRPAFEERLRVVAPSVSGNRVLLLDRQHRIVFDSESQDTYGTQISVTASKRVANIGEARTSFDGQRSEEHTSELQSPHHL